jgi:large subunit ribosomal protein L37Ae
VVKKKTKNPRQFGARYGMRLRRRWQEIEEKQRRYHECPTCKRLAVKRIASGIWGCRRCGAKFTGGAYVPTTGMMKTVEKALRRVGGGDVTV